MIILANEANDLIQAYFKEAYKKFDNWTLVAASYNMGMAGVQWQISNQGVSNFYDMYLNTETSRYVFRLLAVKEILEHPVKYGFHFKQYQLYKPIKTKTIIIDTTIKAIHIPATSLIWVL